ncbi:MAG: hypothetical protein HC788_13650 [Sphingopyxis sp.]|nr:hypothetical protein [Sphingopyxis sp.]
MTGIGIGAALGQAKALLVQDRAALALYLALGVLVPFLLHAAEPALSLRALVSVTAGGGFFSGSLTGPMYLFAIMAVVWTAAQFALWNALLPDLREGPVGEIMYGLVAGVAFLLCYIVFSILFVLIPGGALTFVLAPLTMTNPQWAVATTSVQSLVNLVLGAFIGSRLWLTGPIMAAAGSMNPLPALLESWRRTAPSWGKLFLLFFSLQLVGGLIAAGMFAGHTAIIFADPAAVGYGETAMSVVWLCYWLTVFVMQSLLAAGLFRAASEGSSSEVFA